MIHMLTFAKEILGVVVHGTIALLCIICASYNIVRKNWPQVAFYVSVAVAEIVKIHRHMQDAFKEPT